MMIGILTLVLVVVMIITAIMTVISKDLLNALIMLSLIGLIAVVLFFIMNAPDVALTEAAIGAGLTVIIFIIAIRKIGRYENEGE